MGVLFSRPPLLPMAALNISHYQKASDLTQSLHIAAQPILIGAGMDDLTNGNTSDSAIGLSVNNMLLTSRRQGLLRPAAGPSIPGSTRRHGSSG